jgi:hypothetical protein
MSISPLSAYFHRITSVSQEEKRLTQCHLRFDPRGSEQKSLGKLEEWSRYPIGPD